MIALIDYGMGNLLSVHKALQAVGGNVEVIDKPADIAKATSIVLPGVGNFGDGMEHLNSSGLGVAVKDFIKTGKPYLGICLGMQMLMETSEEAPKIKGLGVFKGRVIHFPKSKEKVPHMGWNSISIKDDNAKLANISNNTYFYFVHSYYVVPENPNIIAASCNYIVDFTASINYKNIFATQFHPEKSQDEGLKILKNFVK